MGVRSADRAELVTLLHVALMEVPEGTQPVDGLGGGLERDFSPSFDVLVGIARKLGSIVTALGTPAGVLSYAEVHDRPEGWFRGPRDSVLRHRKWTWLVS